VPNPAAVPARRWYLKLFQRIEDDFDRLGWVGAEAFAASASMPRRGRLAWVANPGLGRAVERDAEWPSTRRSFAASSRHAFNRRHLSCSFRVRHQRLFVDLNRG
jgi:hypothetical protein